MGKLKSFIAIFFAVLFIGFQAQAQTDAWTTYDDINIKDAQGKITAKHIRATFTMDSTGSILLSKVIDLSDFMNVDMYTYPATFRFKTVSTYDSSTTTIRLLACYQNSTDTAFAIDTIRPWGQEGVTATQIETDSTGTLTFNGKIAPMVRIGIQCLRSDVNSGYLDIVFKKPD